MAQRRQVVLTDNIDGRAAKETARFGLCGTDEIDLSKKHADQLAQAVRPHFWATRRVAVARRHGARPAGQRRRQAAARERARAQGIEVSDKGRIPTDLLATYAAVH